MVNIGNDWDEILKDEFKSEYYLNLRQFLKREYFSRTIYPPMNDIFNALKATPYSAVRAVILGQDPYHGPGQAHGMCFSVRKGIEPPPSLVNIFKELKDDLGFDPPNHGCLQKWADNGVLLLNTVLTVRAGSPNSHKGQGWEIFTDNIIRKLNERPTPIVFILWGANAKSKESLITEKRHCIIKSSHPSPLSAYNGFFGSRPFSAANRFLVSHGLGPIDWKIGDDE